MKTNNFPEYEGEEVDIKSIKPLMDSGDGNRIYCLEIEFTNGLVVSVPCYQKKH